MMSKETFHAVGFEGEGVLLGIVLLAGLAVTVMGLLDLFWRRKKGRAFISSSAARGVSGVYALPFGVLMAAWSLYVLLSLPFALLFAGLIAAAALLMLALTGS